MKSRVRLTRHAVARAMDRFGMTREELLTLAQLAKRHGLRHDACAGRLRHWVERSFGDIEQQPDHEVRIVDGAALLFAGESVITLVKVPRVLLRSARNQVAGAEAST